MGIPGAISLALAPPDSPEDSSSPSTELLLGSASTHPGKSWGQSPTLPWGWAGSTAPVSSMFSKGRRTTEVVYCL